MSKTLILPTYLMPYADNSESLEVNGGTVDECLKEVISRYPGMKDMLYEKNGKLHTYVATYVNGEDVFPNEQSKAVRDGDKIHILYMILGG